MIKNTSSLPLHNSAYNISGLGSSIAGMVKGLSGLHSFSPVWLQQTRIGLSLFDVQGLGYLKETVSVPSHEAVSIKCVHNRYIKCLTTPYLFVPLWVHK